MEENSVKLLTDKIETAVVTLSDKLGVASDHFYPILIKQQLIEGWLWLGAAVPILVVAKLLTYLALKNMKDIDTGGQAFWALLLYLIAITMVVLNIAQIVNPEYYALKEIASLIK